MHSFASFSPLLFIKITQITKNLSCIKCSYRIQVHFEILNQMLNHPNHFVMGLLQIRLMFLVCRVHHQFIQSITKMNHAIYRRERIGVLEVFILHANDASYMFQFTSSPGHSTFSSNIVSMGGHFILLY